MQADETMMGRAIELAAGVRSITSPNPWVGAVLVTSDGSTFEGATEPPGHRHAEIVALDAAGAARAHVAGATMYTTLEPCSHHARTGPCTDALIAAGVARVIVGMDDPDKRVAGRGIEQLLAAGISVDVGVRRRGARSAGAVREAPHDRPPVGAAQAGGIARRPHGRARRIEQVDHWIGGARRRAPTARRERRGDRRRRNRAHRRPALTVRDADGDDPLRVVLGHAPAGARVHPCVELEGPLVDVLDELGRRGVVQAMVEGGPTVAGAFHREGLVDRYVLYLAPALFGGDDGRPLMAGAGAATIDDVWRGRITSVEQLGDDLRVELEAV